ncbi:hypothetical protein NCLIV_057340 [Neospora caninum Liverpool]|uniref:Uncharacterized protein n=1 Tax=Neospora caninum (strain Liverpool) TaxID=572307 RepID=F0VNL5_NEOCL|nr:hypothetical protein NCLIV_057340 [Neospora caninum Liverpool]CBZ55311.1 hypothetical protein NCLIV_057340 [Neospora caninum Liverpool]CEL70043.1 TPA: hypothetical protein BN1204_057340 [Neospora caninum Liverpool]|eukprot:XP_003885339.1 hypothetical protein NCLIV_057340 [Neospora caninum Liverpool]
MVTAPWRRERVRGSLASSTGLRKASTQCQSVLVSEWLANKLIRRYLEAFTEQTWPAVVKWTFVLGVLSLKNSGIPFHSLSVEDLVDIVNQNGYSSLTPAQRLVPLQWATSTPSRSEPREDSVSPAPRCRDGAAGVSTADATAASGGACRKRVTFSRQLAGSPGHSASAVARKPSSDWRAGDPAVFVPPRAAPISSLPEAPAGFSSAPETYPSWWGDSAFPPRANCPYTAAALGPRLAPPSLSSPRGAPLSSASGEEPPAASARLSAVHTPHASCVCGAQENRLVSSRPDFEPDGATATPKFGCFAGLKTRGELDAPFCSAFPPSVALSPSCLPCALPGSHPSSSKFPRGAAGLAGAGSRLQAAPKPAHGSSPPSGSANPRLTPRSHDETPSLSSLSPCRPAARALPAERRRSHAARLKQRNLHASRPAPRPLPPIDGFQAFRPAQEARWVCTLRPSSHRHLPPPSPRTTSARERGISCSSRMHAQAPLWEGGGVEACESFGNAEEKHSALPPWGLETPFLVGTEEPSLSAPPRDSPRPRDSGEDAAIAHAVETARAAATPFRRAFQEETFEDLPEGSPKLACSSYFEAALAAYSENPGGRIPGGHPEGGSPRARVACSWEIDVHGRSKRADKNASLACFPGGSEMRFGRGSFGARNPISLAEVSGGLGSRPRVHAAPSASSEVEELNSSPRSAARESRTDSETLSSLSLDRVAFSPSGVAARGLTAADVSFAPLPHPGGERLALSGDEVAFEGRGNSSPGVEGERRRAVQEASPLRESFLSSESSFREAGRPAADRSPEVEGRLTRRQTELWREKESAAIKDLLEVYWGEAEQIEKGESKGDSELEDTQEATCFDSPEIASPETENLPIDSSPE